LVSPTDILEALVGELPDLTPQERSLVQRPDGSWLVDGSVPIEDLKALLQVPELPGEQGGRFRTIAGFVIYNLHKIPSEGEQFAWEGNRFEVVDMDGNRIDKILLVPGLRGDALSVA